MKKTGSTRRRGRTVASRRPRRPLAECVRIQIGYVVESKLDERVQVGVTLDTRLDIGERVPLLMLEAEIDA
jgi:hypothetical protein